MKKLMILLAVLLLAALPALAEDNPLAPFVLTYPEGTEVVPNPNGTSLTCVDANQSTRVVAMVLSRVPDEDGDHDAELRKLMEQFAPGAQDFVVLEMTPGFYGLQAVLPGALNGAGGLQVDQMNVMVLRQSTLSSELLILSGYDMNGDGEALAAFMAMLLENATLNDAPLLQHP